MYVSLLEVAKKLYEGTNNELPSENPIQKVSNDYYIVNVNNDFDAEVLEFYLKSEFEKASIKTDFGTQCTIVKATKWFMEITFH